MPSYIVGVIVHWKKAKQGQHDRQHTDNFFSIVNIHYFANFLDCFEYFFVAVDFLGKVIKKQENKRVSSNSSLEIVWKVDKKVNIHSVKSLLLKKMCLYKVGLGMSPWCKPLSLRGQAWPSKIAFDNWHFWSMQIPVA